MRRAVREAESSEGGKHLGASVSCRPPRIEDAARIHALIRRCPPLDLNTLYCYLLVARDHARTSVVAELDSEIAGFISAYLRPQAPDTVFIWQVAVDERARGRRIASRMLDDLLARDACRDVRYLETTVSPSNSASRRMFEALATRRETHIESSPLFSEQLFGALEHEAEDLYRVGPLRTVPRSQETD